MILKHSAHLKQLEAESIYIFREVVSEFNNPVMLYSLGKDSSVMLHLAQKSFYPSKIPFPLLHVDTGWKFREMYNFRDKMINFFKLNLIIHKNNHGLSLGVNPLMNNINQYTNIMKTEGLKQAIEKYHFDAAFGGARRDEEKSRAKERIYSFRDSFHRWDPKKQRPELWNNYNSNINPGESIRVFPLSNWTELDIWQYILIENIDIVPLYFSGLRPILQKKNILLMIDDHRFKMNTNEFIKYKMVRFRTLGCWPLTNAVESKAQTIPKIIEEILTSNTSERVGRKIDHDQKSSMELKKRQGYF